MRIETRNKENNENKEAIITGTISRTPELKHVGQYEKAVLKMGIRYDTQKDEAGKSIGRFLDVDLWDGAENLDGMLEKGDAVILTGQIQKREYNEKTYESLRTTGLFIDAAVVFRWLQQVIDANQSALAAFMSKVQSLEAQTIQYDLTKSIDNHEFYPEEQVTEHPPQDNVFDSEPQSVMQEPASNTDFIACDDEDLPF